MPQPLLRTVELKKYFPTRKGLLHAVDGINLTIFRGQTLGVVGESGCGKSTLGRLVLRLLDATSGAIYFGGEDICRYRQRQLKQLRTRMQIIFQDPYSSINPRMTVAEIIADPLFINRIYDTRSATERRVLELMDTVGLARRLSSTYPHELDGGRRQRIGIARALSVNPEFIVCDEPVSALDVSIQAQILNLLMDLQEQMGLTYLFITHNLAVVKHISNDIMVMYLGQCVELAPSATLFAGPLHPYTQALLRAIPTLDIRKRGARRELLRGEVTSPINPAPGCRFYSRCQYAHEACHQPVPLREVQPGHFVACTLVQGSG